MEVDYIADDDTYAVIVSETGETQVFRLGCVDNSSNSDQLDIPMNADVARDPADVISKECNKVAEPSVADRRPRMEIKSWYAWRKEKKFIGQEPALIPEGVSIPPVNESQRRFRLVEKLPRPECGDEEDVPETTGNFATEGVYDEEYAEDNSHLANNNSRTKFYWTRAMTRALVDEYRALTVDFRNPRKRQRDVWESLAEALRRKGHAGITWDMCDRKWRNLKSTFKTIYYSNRELYSKRRWEFYDEFKVLFAPDVRATRMERKSRTIQPPSASSQDLRTILFQAGDDRCENLDGQGDSTGTSEQPSWFSEFLDSYRTVSRTELDIRREQHNKRMKIERRTCELLERLIDSV